MKITYKQLQFMFQVLTDSLTMDAPMTPFKFTHETRKKYAEDIFNQQPDDFVTLEDREKMTAVKVMGGGLIPMDDICPPDAQA